MNYRVWTKFLALLSLAGSLLLYMPWQMVLFLFAFGGILLAFIVYKHCMQSAVDLVSENIGQSLHSTPIDFLAAKSNKKAKIYQFPTVNNIVRK